MEKQLCYVLSQITLENIQNLFIQACNYAISKLKHIGENIVPVIDRGMFHNYVHVCKQLFSCDVIGSRYSLSTPLLRVSYLFIRE